MDKSTFTIPPEVSCVTETLEKAGFEAYLVGGCVRDLLLGRAPRDWDITTNAEPEAIQRIFPHTFYENDYGTVGVVNDDVSRGKETDDVSRATKHQSKLGTPQALEVIEVTPYRLESKYSDHRRPDEVRFSQNLEDDLKRRDFTCNAIAYSVSRGTLIDPFGGAIDAHKRLIKAVGEPKDRFNEDALRLMRAVRLATELDFTIDKATEDAIAMSADTLAHISVERIRDELVKILQSDNPMRGLVMAQKLGLNRYILPELEEGIGCEQMATHAYDVWEHNLRSLDHAAKKGWPFHIRLAALLHDVGKPKTRRMGEKKWTFYGHDVVGGRMTRKIMDRLKFDKKLTDTVEKLVRYHLFFSDTDQITLSAVRRMVANVGEELIWDLMNLRVCDRIGTGRPKEQPFRLRKYQAMIEEVLRNPISPKLLKINGEGIMSVTRETPSRRIGWILHALLEEALDDPNKNTEEYLQKRALELSRLPQDELMKLGEEGKEKKEALEEQEIAEISKKYHV